MNLSLGNSFVPGNSPLEKGGPGVDVVNSPLEKGARVDRVNSPLEKVCQGAEALPLRKGGPGG